MSDAKEPLESKLLREIAALNARIKDMDQERRSLERLLVRSRRENAAAQEVTRVSSGSRIIVERSVITYLTSRQNRAVTTAELKQVAQGAELRLNDNTFRSHLHRLKQRGLIASAGHGRWRLSQESN